MVWRAVLERLGISVVTLWVVSVLIFIGTNLLPGDVAAILLGQMATPESLAALQAKLGIDEPGYVRYFMWLGNVVTGDLGMSKAGLAQGNASRIADILEPRILIPCD